MRDLLTIDALSPADLVGVIDDADDLKAGAGVSSELAGRAVGLLFETPSIRTRVAFEVGVRGLGGHPVVLAADALEAGGSVEDTARTLSAYLDVLVIATREQGRLEAFAACSDKPVVNAHTDFAHPCQVLADLQTIREYKGALAGVRLAYLGAGNNVANSLLCAGALAGMTVTVGSPPGYGPIPQVVELAHRLAAGSGGRVTVTANPLEAARGADVVYTDAWTAPGSDSEREARLLIFKPFQVGYHLMEAASPDAIVMHCLPAHRGEEIAAEVLDGGQSVVWTQVANRLHTAKAVLRFVLAEEGSGARPTA
jgi:ornithine carbamoyltransferase